MADRTGVIERTPERSAGDLVRDILTDLQQIIHTELQLAKAEITDKTRQAGQAGGMLGGAAVCGLLAAACFCKWVC